MKYKEIFYTTRNGYRALEFNDCQIISKYYSIPVKFRYDPVPGSGKNWHNTNFFRRPKTLQELKWTFEHKKYVRGKRKKKYLPTSWDDIPRNDRKNKNWKSCTKRRKQYK